MDLLVLNFDIFSFPIVDFVTLLQDQLQNQNDLCSVSVANAEADEDITSSLNTLLDTRPDSASDSDRIVWTYNAPITDHHKFGHTLSNGSGSSHSNVSPTSSR